MGEPELKRQRGGDGAPVDVAEINDAEDYEPEARQALEDVIACNKELTQVQSLTPG